MIRKHPRGRSLEVRVYAGRDPITRRERYVSRSVTGTGRPAMKRAKELEGELLVEIAKARPAVGAAATLTVLVARWREVARHEASTTARMEPMLRRHILDHIGHLPVAQLTSEHIDALYVDLERGDPDAGRRPLAPSSVKRLHVELHAALTQAVRWGWIDRNPAEHAAERLDLSPAEPKAPAPEIVKAVMLAAWERDPELACLIRLGAATGIRRGEACAIRRSNLDLAVGVLRKTHAIGDAAGRLYEKPTKTRTAHALALDAGTVTALAGQIALVDERAQTLGEPLVADPYLFCSDVAGARPVAPDQVTKRVTRLRDTVAGAGDVTYRSLRHFVTTQLLEGQASITTVTSRGGWSSAATPLARYAAFVPAADRDAADIMGRVLDGG